MGFPDIFEQLLRERNISEGEKEVFLNPDYAKLHDPLLLPNMSVARDRVISAIRGNEHIVVFSDYDADGIPGAVVMHDLFSRIGYENVSFYIPHRHDEGFGLNSSAVDECAARGAKLLITIDCGIADVIEVAHANSLGMEVIITDHHQPNAELPRAYAIVNPKLIESAYPFKDLCGATLAYKLVQAILEKKRFSVKEGMEKWSLDMVGIATLSDMVPLLGENRILARFGLEVLRKSPRPGLRALMRRLKMEQRHLTEDDISFMITPRINAASRMGVPEDAFKLLSTTKEHEAENLATLLEKINNERKGVVASIVKEAKKVLSERSEMREVIVIGNPEWRPALLGLVANSLVEEYERPVFVWGRDGDGCLKGSCRSYNGYDLYNLMSSTGKSFLEFGGHVGAGGFSIASENIHTLEEKLSEALTNPDTGCLGGSPDPRHLVSEIPIEIKDVCEDLHDIVSQFAPFGTGNPKPIFKIKGDIKSVKQFGKENNHLEITLGDKNGNKVKAIAFFSSPESYGTQLTPSVNITLLASLEKSFFGSRPELRLRIVDIIAV